MIVSRSTSCPHCGDAHGNSCFIVYHDGYKCFSCGKSSRKSEEHFVYRPKTIVSAKTSLHVPANTTDVQKFPTEILEWFYKYYMYDEDIKEAGIAYVAPENERPHSILLPVSYDQNGDTEEYQRRFFPKNFFSSSGVKQVVFVRGEGERLVIVEDYISSLRIGNHTTCLCLFGTSLSDMLMSYIIQNYTDISIWLDNDEPGRAASGKITKQLEKEYLKQLKIKPMLYTSDVSIREIKTEMSAKDYSRNEIKTIIGETNCSIQL